MLRFLCYATLASLLWIGASSATCAGTINLTANGFWNTGVDNSNVKLSTASTSFDSHWTGQRVSGVGLWDGKWAGGDGVKTGGPSSATNGYAVGDTFNVAPTLGLVGPWVADNTSTVSRWITPEKIRLANGTVLNDQGGANGEAHNQSVWEYSLTVNNPVVAPNQLLITGRWASDNDVFILVNGVDTGVKRERGYTTTLIRTFDAWENFTISSDYFNPGANTITFRVRNGVYAAGPGTGTLAESINTTDHSATGLRVEFLSGAEVPEPSSMLVCGGLALCGLVARRRNRNPRVS